MLDNEIIRYIIKTEQAELKELLLSQVLNEQEVLIRVKNAIASDIGVYAARSNYDIVNNLLVTMQNIDVYMGELSEVIQQLPQPKKEQIEPSCINYTQVYPTQNINICPICNKQVVTNTTKYVVYDKNKKHIHSDEVASYYCRECRKRFIHEDVLKNIDRTHGICNTNIEVLECDKKDTVVMCLWCGCTEPATINGYCSYHNSEENYRIK